MDFPLRLTWEFNMARCKEGLSEAKSAVPIFCPCEMGTNTPAEAAAKPYRHCLTPRFPTKTRCWMTAAQTDELPQRWIEGAVMRADAHARGFGWAVRQLLTWRWMLMTLTWQERDQDLPEVMMKHNARRQCRTANTHRSTSRSQNVIFK
jgi:hypothetical protein